MYRPSAESWGHTERWVEIQRVSRQRRYALTDIGLTEPDKFRARGMSRSEFPYGQINLSKVTNVNNSQRRRSKRSDRRPKVDTQGGTEKIPRSRIGSHAYKGHYKRWEIRSISKKDSSPGALRAHRGSKKIIARKT